MHNLTKHHKQIASSRDSELLVEYLQTLVMLAADVRTRIHPDGLEVRNGIVAYLQGEIDSIQAISNPKYREQVNDEVI